MGYFFDYKQYNSKYIIFMNIILLLSAIYARADEVILKNGNVIEGNIIRETNSTINVEVVLNGHLTGMSIEIDKNSVNNIRNDAKYKNLKRKELNNEERLSNLLNYQERNRPKYNIDERIKERIERVKNRNDKIDRKQENKRRFNKILNQEKEILNLKHENRKDLITHSKNKGIRPNVTVIDKP